MANTSVALQEAEEIDLFELIQALWIQRLLIVGVALLMTLAGGAYAFLSKPVYEARVYLQPPTFNGIAEFNFGRTKEAELTPFTVKDVYDVFARNLQSESLRRKFFEDFYLPSLGESQQKGSRDSLYADFSKAVVIEAPTKDAVDRYSVVAQSADPAQAAEWVKVYATRAGDAAKKEMIRNVTREAEVRARNLGQQISTLKENGQKTVQDSVVQLHEALRIAEAIGLENPPIISGDVSSEISASMDGQLTYMRGAKALRAEIKNLEDRKSNDPFIEKLRSLQIKQSFYQGLSVSPESVAVYRQDGSIEQPDKPIKPKKALILIIGLLLGGALGLALAMVRYFIRRSAA
jgi:chain length determinant protein (polysaccharide antigen chain regulator)